MGFLDNQKRKLKESNAQFKKSMAETNAKSSKQMTDIKADYKTANNEVKSGWAKFRQENHEKVEARKAENDAIKQTRGNELGYVKIGYVGGFDNQKRMSAKLIFYEKHIEYSYLGNPVNDLVIEGSDVVGLEVGGQQQTNSRVSVTRMATLGVFSLAAPKRSTTKEASVVISLRDGRQVYFHTNNLSEFEVHSKLANAISYYSQKQQAQSPQVQTATSNTSNDAATEIMKYATLRKRGVISEEEFQAKKTQLLGL